MGNYNFSLDLSTDNTMSVINNWIKDGSSVLEFGPANGRLTRHLTLNRRCLVTIVERDYDAGKEAAKYAVRSYLGTNEGDIENFGWINVNEKFDFIIFADVLEHLSEPEKVLKSAVELLNEDGRILISVPNISHNSIIIGLLNDCFTYSNTGLLDSTHIHFFAYNNLKEMIKNTGLYIADFHQIYSRVGHNEIGTSYFEVSGEVGKALRKRINGSTYQFVLNLSKFEIDQCNLNITASVFDEDVREEFESLFFYTFDMDEFKDELRVGTIYREGESVDVIFDMESIGSVKRLRWNPLCFDGVISVLRANLITMDGLVLPLKIKNCNVERAIGRLLVFYDSPWIEYEVPNELNIKRCEITFQVLAYREKNTRFYEQLNAILDIVSNAGDDMGNKLSGVNKSICSARYLENNSEYIENLMEESKDYVRHLENEIKELKKELKRLKKVFL